MTDLFLQSQKLRAEIENGINQLYQKVDYAFPTRIPSDVNACYIQITQSLDKETQLLTNKLTQLQDNIKTMKERSKNSNDIVQQKKYDNLVLQYRDLERNLKKAYVQKSDQLRSEKERLTLFGSFESNQVQSQEEVKLLVDQRTLLTKSHQLVEESLQVGQDVLLSFDRQKNALNNIQQKVSGLMGDMTFSQSLLKMIGGRSYQDRNILVLLSLALMIFIFVLYYVFK